MPRVTPYGACIVCGASREQVGHISDRGRCDRCAAEGLTEAILSLRNHQGEVFERWRSGILRAVQTLPRG